MWQLFFTFVAAGVLLEPTAREEGGGEGGRGRGRGEGGGGRGWVTRRRSDSL